MPLTQRREVRKDFAKRESREKERPWPMFGAVELDELVLRMLRCFDIPLRVPFLCDLRVFASTPACDRMRIK
jgi:hypothetical protein